MAACALRASLKAKEMPNKSFDELRTNGKLLIPFVVSLSNHERNQLVGASLTQRTTVTGQCALTMTSCAIEPSSMRATPVRPTEPVITWS